jgi:hypothetical protein
VYEEDGNVEYDDEAEELHKEQQEEVTFGEKLNRGHPQYAGSSKNIHIYILGLRKSEAPIHQHAVKSTECCHPLFHSSYPTVCERE